MLNAHQQPTNQDDRGQEYCEYFAIVRPPPATMGGQSPPAVDLGRITSTVNRKAVETSPALVLNQIQKTALVDAPDAVIGQCVFTSWHGDIPGPVPTCQAGASCPSVFGFSLSETYFRMKFSFNTNAAAKSLVDACYGTAPPQPRTTKDPLHDDFIRGCMLDNSLFHTSWRRSDPIICSAMMRLDECGCSVPGASDLGAALVPPTTMRGFPLGSWSGERTLPAGCRYAQLGDDSRTVVTCDLTAGDVLVSTNDLKAQCAAQYGADVVVHIPIPAPAVTCRPDRTTRFGKTCGTQPWVIQ